MSKTILAIDPGAAGGLAWVYDGETYAKKMPTTERDICDSLEGLKKGDTVYLEKVHSMPGQGVSSTFKFGENFGFLKGVLTVIGVRIVLITPQKWMKEFELGTRSACASDTVWKNKLKQEAQRLYPEQTVTLATADALLLLEYARRQESSRD